MHEQSSSAAIVVSVHVNKPLEWYRFTKLQILKYALFTFSHNKMVPELEIWILTLGRKLFPRVQICTMLISHDLFSYCKKNGKIKNSTITPWLNFKKLAHIRWNLMLKSNRWLYYRVEEENLHWVIVSLNL